MHLLTSSPGSQIFQTYMCTKNKGEPDTHENTGEPGTDILHLLFCIGDVTRVILHIMLPFPLCLMYLEKIRKPCDEERRLLSEQLQSKSNSDKIVRNHARFRSMTLRLQLKFQQSMNHKLYTEKH